MPEGFNAEDACAVQAFLVAIIIDPVARVVLQPKLSIGFFWQDCGTVNCHHKAVECEVKLLKTAFDTNWSYRV